MNKDQWAGSNLWQPGKHSHISRIVYKTSTRIFYLSILRIRFEQGGSPSQSLQQWWKAWLPRSLQWWCFEASRSVLYQAEKSWQTRLRYCPKSGASAGRGRRINYRGLRYMLLLLKLEQFDSGVGKRKWHWRGCCLPNNFPWCDTSWCSLAWEHTGLLTKNFIAEGSFVNADQLAATCMKKSV